MAYGYLQRSVRLNAVNKKSRTIASRSETTERLGALEPE